MIRACLNGCQTSNDYIIPFVDSILFSFFVWESLLLISEGFFWPSEVVLCWISSHLRWSPYNTKDHIRSQTIHVCTFIRLWLLVWSWLLAGFGWQHISANIRQDSLVFACDIYDLGYSPAKHCFDDIWLHSLAICFMIRMSTQCVARLFMPNKKSPL